MESVPSESFASKEDGLAVARQGGYRGGRARARASYFPFLGWELSSARISAAFLPPTLLLPLCPPLHFQIQGASGERAVEASRGGIPTSLSPETATSAALVGWGDPEGKKWCSHLPWPSAAMAKIPQKGDHILPAAKIVSGTGKNVHFLITKGLSPGKPT